MSREIEIYDTTLREWLLPHRALCTTDDADALVHFLIPFRDWYNDLVFT